MTPDPEHATEPAAETPPPAEATPAGETEPEVPASRRGPKLTRRRLIGLIGGGMVLGAGWRLAVVPRPAPLSTLKLSERARTMIAKAWEGIDPKKVVDIHTHVIGLGVGGTGCFAHPDATSILSPLRWVKTRFYKGAAGIYDEAQADDLYVKRLVDLATHQQPHGRYLLMAFDKHYTKEGQPDLNFTEFYTPNDYIFSLVEKHPQLFLAACSVHPYRADALQELERCRKKGAVAVKWLPNAMGIDPADPRCDAYYEKLAALELTLISHTGEEQAVHAEEAQALGNPLKLRRPLDTGVKVVAAHCASLGTSEDLDAGEDKVSGQRPRLTSYALFRRLLTEKKYEGRLYGGLSAMTQFNRCEDPLQETIASAIIHGRLVNGSDYPLPAIDPLIRTGLLADLGYITAEEREVINEIFEYNPLTFDFVLKRHLKVEKDGKTYRLPASAFETAHLFTPA